MFEEKNAIFLLGGYVVFLSGILLYLLSLAIRRRNLDRDERTMAEIREQLRQDEQGAQR
jgi:hypothetical protein